MTRVVEKKRLYRALVASGRLDADDNNDDAIKDATAALIYDFLQLWGEGYCPLPEPAAPAKSVEELFHMIVVQWIRVIGNGKADPLRLETLH